MSLLTICQNVAEDVGITVPVTVIGNTNQSSARLKRFAQNIGKELARKPFPQLIKEHTFTTIANEDDYALPTDYGWLYNDTVWNRSDSDPAFNRSPRKWQEIKSGLLTNVVDDVYRIKVKQGTLRFFLDPTPSSVETFAFEYVSDQWVVNREGSQLVFKSEFDNDADQGVLDEYLIELGVKWQMLRRIGEPYADERDEFEREIEKRLAQDKAAPTFRSRRFGSVPIVANTGETNFGS